ncbi:MAG: tRNA (adenosine(37)-N6)-threonylcarbamoyltransferase complex transferase subunit TsaD [FCB group bacterium]|nr:tRNA (adenosine(37)-N6)-threonylcarbamoyltransferase complex transferase subunit TsaD [FCB group bacterium]
MIILGLETSCDETSAAIVKEGQVLSNVVFSQLVHQKYGGVVPEIASREHETRIAEVVTAALSEADIDAGELDGIAVTYGAGLMGALLVGLNFAKGLSIGLKKPFLGVNHLEGHLYANLIANAEFDYPFLCLLVSGGHTQIWKVLKFGDYAFLGGTRDDAAGEAFDKGARILGLGYPGGPEIEKMAIKGNPEKYQFTIPTVKSAELDFSFSGLKTALLYKCQAMTADEIGRELPDLCASYQEVIINTLFDKLIKAIRVTGIRKVTVAGGVAANRRFREKAETFAMETSTRLYFPALDYCTDNAAMIAFAGFERMRNGEISSLSLKPNPNLSLGS